MGEQYLAGYRAAMQEVINFVREKHEHFDAEEGKVWDDRTDQRLKRGEPFVMSMDVERFCDMQSREV
jgi:hypothetical protein